MITQMHHQYKDGHTQIYGQINTENHEKFRKFVKEIDGKYPLPEGAMWLFCTSGSKYFVEEPIVWPTGL